MANYDSSSYQPCKEWVAKQINADQSWDAIVSLCVDKEQTEAKLISMIDNELWPEELTAQSWGEFVQYYKSVYIPVRITEGDKVIAIDNGTRNNSYAIPTGIFSAWEYYKRSLTSSMSHVSISNVQKSCNWILNHLSTDTRLYGTIKGLVTGSVQSGKTANMEGLVSMAADYDWNFFIVLSGTIDNLRKQTRDRFIKDLKCCEGILWRILDFTGEDKSFAAEELKLNPLLGSKNFAQRYVTVCLKNKIRLEALIKWLYDDPKRTSKLRIVVIDDEADQASINTAEITPEEEQERCVINQLIVNLVNGKRSDGSTPDVKFQAMNYISYTATPYANVLNESGVESLYPKDFICTLPEAKEYFGAKVIFGNDEQSCPGMGIVREISDSEEKMLKKIHKGVQHQLPGEMKNSIAWFICASAVLRIRGYKKSISMLVHTSAIQKEHFVIYDLIKQWIGNTNEVLAQCEMIYQIEKDKVTIDDLKQANPDYGLLNSVTEEMPSFEEIMPELKLLLANISNIMLNEDNQMNYTKGIHLCVDNCSANREADEGTYLRIVYPTDEQVLMMEKAPVFIVIGGNTLSRGLTIDGLVCTYFSRNSNQADTLMQMARWFGYKKGYELLQRIWMTELVQQKFEALAKIDMDLKREIELFMERGISPSQFGPRVRNIPEIAKFRITAKNKGQSAEYADFDFCGDSYETTDFEDNAELQKNIALTESVLKMLCHNIHSRRSATANAFVWDNVDYSFIRDEFLIKYRISDFSPLHVNLRYFKEWIEKMNVEGKLLKWNVALVDGDNKSSLWPIGNVISVGSIERTKKAGKRHIDIGSLRSGRDAICDVDESGLTSKQAAELKDILKNGKNIISRRSSLNLEDKPLLLIYRIMRDGGIPKTNRVKIDSAFDIIGISIIVSGDSIGESHAKSLRIII